MAGLKKTNAMRILDTAGCAYSVTQYDVDEQHLDARTAAEHLSIPPEQVFKTIVMSNEDRAVFVFCVPAGSEVNIKKVRALTGSKEMIPVKQSELPVLTGYVRGGCSPLGMKKKYPVFIDETAVLFDRIYVSAGVRGIQLAVGPENLADAAQARFAELT